MEEPDYRKENPAIPNLSCPTGRRPFALFFAWLVLLAAVMALLEIQIEGSAGWAANLPTWRIRENPALQWLMGGREITGYHTLLFTFMALVFHLPLVLSGQCTLRMECRILSGLMLFWLMEDFLWFVFNPAYGIARLTPQYAFWHPRWFLHVPMDYLLLGPVGLLLLLATFLPPKIRDCP